MNVLDIIFQNILEVMQLVPGLTPIKMRGRGGSENVYRIEKRSTIGFSDH